MSQLRQRHVCLSLEIPARADFARRDHQAADDVRATCLQHLQRGRKVGIIGDEDHLIDVAAQGVVIEMKGQIHIRSLLLELPDLILSQSRGQRFGSSVGTICWLALSEIALNSVHNAIDKRIIEAHFGREGRELFDEDLLRLKLWYGVGSILSA